MGKFTEAITRTKESKQLLRGRVHIGCAACFALGSERTARASLTNPKAVVGGKELRGLKCIASPGHAAKGVESSVNHLPERACRGRELCRERTFSVDLCVQPLQQLPRTNAVLAVCAARLLFFLSLGFPVKIRSPTLPSSPLRPPATPPVTQKCLTRPLRHYG